MSQSKRAQTSLAGGASLVTVQGAQPGPTLALLGGVHGDEDEGVLAVHRVLQAIDQWPLSGTVRAVAPANPLAWAAQRRTGPLDEADLARCFPGDVAGNPTSMIAASITEAVIAGADCLIDLHSAGVRYRMPLFCGFVNAGRAAERSRRAALAFGAPIIWVHDQSGPGRSVFVAGERGIPAIYAECAGGGGIDAGDLEAYVCGVVGVMHHLGMLPETAVRPPQPSPQLVYGGGNLDAGAQARCPGFFVNAVEAGSIVAEGEAIGQMYDYQGRSLEVIRAPSTGMVMFLRRQARVRTNDVLFALARLEETRA